MGEVIEKIIINIFIDFFLKKRNNLGWFKVKI